MTVHELHEIVERVTEGQVEVCSVTPDWNGNPWAVLIVIRMREIGPVFPEMLHQVEDALDAETLPGLMVKVQSVG